MNYGGGAAFSRSGELTVLQYLARYLNEKSPRDEHVVFDVGANEGGYSLSVLGAGIRNLRLFSFEPSRATYTRLQGVLANYSEVETVNVALGRTDQSGVLHMNPGESGLSSLFPRRLDHFGVELTEQEPIQVRSLESYCREEDIQHISLLKLDVEGNELEILDAAKSLLTHRMIDFIQFEFGSAHIDSRTFFQDFWYLLTPNYRIFRVLHRGLQPIDRYKETLEIFLPTNYLAAARTLPMPSHRLRPWK